MMLCVVGGVSVVIDVCVSVVCATFAVVRRGVSRRGVVIGLVYVMYGVVLIVVYVMVVDV